MFFFPAVLDTNGKMTTFFVLPILQKLKPEGFFHHKEFLKEISSIQYQVLVKFRRNRCKIIIFEFPLTTETLHWLLWIWIMQSNWIWKKIETSDHFTASHKTFCFPFFSCFSEGLHCDFFLKVTFALLLRKKLSEMTFPYCLNYGENYKTFILPIVQKAAGKKIYTIFKACKKSNSCLFEFF